MSPTGRIADWRQWGFHRRTQNNETNPDHTQAPNQPTPTPTTTTRPPTTNGANLAIPVANANNTRQNNANNGTQHPAPPGATYHETPAPTPLAQHQTLDSYLNPWGDQLQLPKPPDTLRICLQNFGGWPQTTKQQKNDNIRGFVNSAEIDIFLTTENNIAWHKLPGGDRLPERTRGWWESINITTAHNTTDGNTGKYQPGGVGVLSVNRAAHRVKSFGRDPTGLGRYCWTVLQGRDQKILRVVAAYRPSKSNNGHLSVTQQHWRHFANQQPTTTGLPHPRTQFWTDLKPLLQSWIDTGEQVLVGMDANDFVGDPTITDFFGTLGMAEAILHRHGTDAPPTHQCGSQAIDGLFVTHGLLGHNCGYLGGMDGVTGDHRGLWIDLPELWLFGSAMPPIIRAGARRLKSDDPRTRNRYLEQLDKYFTEHLILQKAQAIETALLTQELQPYQEEELERLDDLRIQGMLQAERQCRKLHTRPYGWTPELTRLMTELRYWRGSLRQAEGRTYNAHFLYRLATALQLPTLPPSDSTEAIRSRIAAIKAKLRRKLGDPNRRETWLEGLAAAQTAATGGDQAKRLRHLMRTEEQRSHARQIRRTNSTARTSGGLSAISVKHPDGTTIHHTDKATMEEACLAEACSRFTQANDTPFLTPPLLNELGLLDCYAPPFDEIAEGIYQPPAGTTPGASSLLSKLKRPQEVPDCDLNLTETIHCEGWQKAKERTASSLSGAHFGHYKAGTFNEMINAVHTALSAIPLKTGYSYNRWKKGINVMLEKIPGNFQVDKLRIILLFEADFNQLNKYIGKQMMSHAELHGLVAAEQYGSRHGRSSITQSLNKRLTFDNIRQLRQAAIICSNDAKSCYDRIVHRVAAQSMYRCGTSKPALICMFSTIQRLRHHIRTLFGDSQISAGTDLWAVPISGIGQGNGAGPQIWAVVSTPILDMLRDAGFGASFKLAVSGNQVSFVGYSFVDDTDLIQTGPTITSTDLDVIPLMQAALSLWETGLRATGGALVPEKSFWYLIDFRWRGSTWRYAKYPTEPGSLSMPDNNQHEHSIKRLPADKAQRTLGVYLAPDGNNKAQLQILLEKTKTWADNSRTGHLNKVAAWLNLTSTILRQVYYVLPATTFTQAQCDTIMAPCFRGGLPAAGYMRSFPRVILQAPYKYFGLGITNLYHEQGIQHLLALLRHGSNPNDITGQLLRIGLENMRLELGLNGQIFAYDWDSLHLLTTPTWLSHTWKFQNEHRIRIETTTPNIPLAREGDTLLTEAFFNAGIRGKELGTINRCRVYLQVATLADITDGSGHYIADPMLIGKPNQTFTSGFTWPNQGTPTKQEWAKWYLGLQLAIPVDNYGRFLKPLGKWLVPWDKHQHRWHWLLQKQPLQLFHWETEWRVHLPINSRATRQLKFSTQYYIAENNPPTTAIRVTGTITQTYITISNGHGHIDQADIPQHTWETHLDNLEEDKRWALTNLDLPADGLPLAVAIQLGTARAVSDGSFKDQFGTAAWVYYDAITNETLGNGRLNTPGYPEDQCSYRSEISGIYGIAVTILELAKFHDLRGGAIQVACDGESALHRCFKPWSSNPLAKHFDIIHATRAAITASTITWTWEHVRGHQDETQQPLTITEQRNVEMDAAAKEHWNQQIQQPVQRGPLIRFHGETWRIFLGEKKASTNLKYRLLEHIAGKAAQAYWSGKKRFQGIDTNQVDWATVEKVLESQTINMRRWTVKFVTGFCATGSRMAHNKQRKTSECPRCGYPRETTAHILQCPEVGSQTVWDASILQIRHNLLETDTDPSLIEDISAGLDAWRRNAAPPAAITPAGTAQTALTWDNFVHGIISKEWKLQQANYYTTRNNPSSTTTWAADLLRALLKSARQQWDHRNKVLHKLQPDRVKDQIIDTEIRQQYDRGRAQLPSAARTLLNRPLPTMLELPHNEKQQWLHSIKAARQRQRLADARTAQAQRTLLANFLNLYNRVPT